VKEQVTIQGVIEKETERAILLKVGEKPPVWLPKSQVEFDADTGTVIMPRWLVDAKEIET
jgi:hypothetical protein